MRPLVVYEPRTPEHDRLVDVLRNTHDTSRLPVCPSCHIGVSLSHNPVFTSKATLHGTCAVWFLLNYVRDLEAELDVFRRVLRRTDSRPLARMTVTAEKFSELKATIDENGRFRP